jgi:integrase
MTTQMQAKRFGNVVPLRRPQADPKGPRLRRPRRSFGAIRELESGRFQAYYTLNGQRHLAPTTFFTRADASAWLAMREAELVEHRWKPAPPPDPQKVRFGDYAEFWLAGRDLSPKTAAHYRGTLRGRLAIFADFTLDDFTPMMIKRWWEEMDKTHPYGARGAYELLRAILATASRPDEDTDLPPLIPNNPARLSAKTLRRATGAAGHFRRPRTRVQPATLEELDIIVREMPDRYRAMVLLAAWCAPRFGELTELRRKDLIIRKDQQGDPVSGVVRIERAVIWPEPDQPLIKEPKSEAGIRDVAIPPHILPALLEHLDNWAAPGPEGLLFPAVESGRHMKSGALYKVYRRARAIAGRPDMRWHDLRHTGATMAAQAGATLAELMNRLGHANAAAALIYQHAAAGRDEEIARKLSDMAYGHMSREMDGER